MSETEKTQKKSWFKGLQAEFKKVIWPDKKTLARQTPLYSSAASDVHKRQSSER